MIGSHAAILLVTLTQMCSMVPHVGGPRQLTQNKVMDSGVTLSRDGKTIAWLQLRQGTIREDVLVMDLASGKVTNLTAGDAEGVRSEEAFEPQFTPDGKSVLYLDDGDLWQAGLDGSAPTQITQGQFILHFQVVPNWKSVVFTSQRAMALSEFVGKVPEGIAGLVITKLFVYDLDSKSINMLNRYFNADKSVARILPDGKILVITEYMNDKGEWEDRGLSMIDPKGNRTRVKLSAPFSFRPAFLDGGNTMVLLEMDFEGEKQVFKLITWDFKAQQHGVLELPLPVPQEAGQIWSTPDFGGLIMSLKLADGTWDLYGIDIATKAVVRLTNRNFKWGPEGGQISADGKTMVFVGGPTDSAFDNEVFVLDLQ